MSPLFADTVLEVHAKLISCAIRKMPGMKLSQNYMLKLVLILAQGSGFPMLLFIGGWGGGHGIREPLPCGLQDLN